MSNKDIFYSFLIFLNSFGFEFSNELVKDLDKLIQSDIAFTLKNIAKDFLTYNFDSYNKFERLNLNKEQKELVGNVGIYRYEYRKYSNLRILFTAKIGTKFYLLCAFNENAGKTNSKESYNSNINRAINILNKMRGDKNEN